MGVSIGCKYARRRRCWGDWSLRRGYLDKYERGRDAREGGGRSIWANLKGPKGAREGRGESIWVSMKMAEGRGLGM